jgi:hypothetical protein
LEWQVPVEEMSGSHLAFLSKVSLLDCSLTYASVSGACWGVISRMRAREQDAAIRRGVIWRRRRVMRCRKPYQRWGMKITTRPFFTQGLKRRDPPHHHHPECQCGLRMCLVYLYLFVSCVQLRLLVQRIFNGSLGGLR